MLKTSKKIMQIGSFFFFLCFQTYFLSNYYNGTLLGLVFFYLAICFLASFIPIMEIGILYDIAKNPSSKDEERNQVLYLALLGLGICIFMIFGMIYLMLNLSSTSLIQIGIFILFYFFLIFSVFSSFLFYYYHRYKKLE